MVNSTRAQLCITVSAEPICSLEPPTTVVVAVVVLLAVVPAEAARVKKVALVVYIDLQVVVLMVQVVVQVVVQVLVTMV